MGFQNRVKQQPAPAVAGDFASTNPRASVTAPKGGYMAAPDYPAAIGGALGPALLVGRFAWANPATGLMSNYFQANSLLGFVHRENQTIITSFLGEQRLAIQAGFPATAQSQGDYWADFAASAPDAAGLSVYADPVTGIATAAAAGGSAVATGWTGAVSVAGLLTVTGAGAGAALAVGQAVVDPLGLIAPGSFIVALGTGAGGLGTYQLNQAPAVAIAAAAFTAYGKQETRYKLATPVAGIVSFTGVMAGSGATPLPDGVVAASAIAGGVLTRGQSIAGAGLPPFAAIVGQNSGAPGGAGNYQTNVFQIVASEAMTATAGTLGKISTWQA